MKPGYSHIILILLVLAALSLSGCTGSNKDKKLQVLSQLYDVSDYHMFRYAGNATMNESVPLDYRYDMRVWYANETYKNVEAVHTNMTMHFITLMRLNESELGGSGLNRSSLNLPDENQMFSIPMLDITMAIDAYVDIVNNKTLGGHMMATAGGGLFAGAGGNAPILDRDLNESDLADIDNRSAQFLDMSRSRAPLTYVGKDKVVFKGRTYDCTVYNFTSMDMPYTAWYSPDVPVPMRFKCINSTAFGPLYMTYELQEWA